MEQPVNDDLVPLLDSVAGLLEKERELGELKLEAAQHEGQQWRELQQSQSSVRVPWEIHRIRKAFSIVE